MLRTSREHVGNILKRNIFKKIIDGKVVFVLKMYDLTITNVDLLANSNNHKGIFPEYLKNIPQVSLSKILQGYPRNIVSYKNVFMKSKSVKNCFVGYPVKFLILAGRLLSSNIFLNFIETVFHLE